MLLMQFVVVNVYPKSKRMKTTSTRAKLTTSLTGDLIAASLLEGVQNSNKSPCVQVSW